MLYDLAYGIKNIPYRIAANTKNFAPQSAISLFCDPRGGSTWLAETLNCIPKSTIIDEPLHLGNIKKNSHLKFGWRQYIPEEEPWPLAKQYISKVLRGKTC